MRLLWAAPSGSGRVEILSFAHPLWKNRRTKLGENGRADETAACMVSRSIVREKTIAAARRQNPGKVQRRHAFWMTAPLGARVTREIPMRISREPAKEAGVMGSFKNRTPANMDHTVEMVPKAASLNTESLPAA